MLDPIKPSVIESVWTPYCGEIPGARLTLLCFHCAGSGASMFRNWKQLLQADIDVRPVQLPGRENRIQETSYTSVEPLARDVAIALESLLSKKPFAMFGHSMGALVAFEVAREIRKMYKLDPVHLFLSSYPAVPGGQTRQRIADLPEDVFLDIVAQYNCIPSQILKNPEWTAALSGLLRADVAMCESYVYRPGPPFECPISAFGGLKDPHVSRDELLAWQDQTIGPFKIRLFPGDHSYHQQCRERLLAAISAELEKS